MATVTVKGGNQPQAVHAGLNQIVCKISLSLTWSSGDIHIVGKLPHGAIPTDAVFYIGAGMTSTGTAKFGTSATLEMLAASQTWTIAGPRGTAANLRRLGYAVQISLSDDAMPRYENIIATFGGTGITAGYLGDLVVSYVMPGQTA